MKKSVLTGVLLLAAIFLAGAQLSYAYSTLEGGCLTCHTTFAGGSGTGHTGHAAASVTCTACHTTPGATPIASGKCIVCHPNAPDTPGQCNLVNLAAHPKSGAQSCLGCHSTCAPAGECADWKGVWEFTYDNATSTTFCFDNKTAIDNASLVLCVDNATKADNCTCISGIDPDNASLGIDNTTVPYSECDNNSEAGCIFVKNPMYKKLTVAKGKYEVKITDAQKNFPMGPLMASCFATGTRGTQAISINQPNDATLAAYAKYFPNSQKGMYFIQEGSGQNLSNISQYPQTRILQASFTGDNFTSESPYWNIPGLVSGKFVRALTCDELDNCTDIETECVLKIVPKRIFKLLAFFNPFSPFVISAPSDSGIEFSRPISIDWGTDTINDLIRIRIGKRIIFGLGFVRPFQLESDNYTVTVTYGDNNTEECGTLEVK